MTKTKKHRGLTLNCIISPDNKDWQMTEVIDVTRYQLQVVHMTARWVNEDGEYLDVTYNNLVDDTANEQSLKSTVEVLTRGMEPPGPLPRSCNGPDKRGLIKYNKELRTAGWPNPREASRECWKELFRKAWQQHGDRPLPKLETAEEADNHDVDKSADCDSEVGNV